MLTPYVARKLSVVTPTEVRWKMLVFLTFYLVITISDTACQAHLGQADYWEVQQIQKQLNYFFFFFF